MQHNLEQLGHSGFQDRAAALTIAEVGPGVQVLGSGRDGGRDMYYNGTLVWSGTEQEPAETWDGYTVFQVKQKERLAARAEDNASTSCGDRRRHANRQLVGHPGRRSPTELGPFTPLGPVCFTVARSRLDEEVRECCARA